MISIDSELKTLEEEEARLAERKEALLNQKKEEEKKLSQLDKLIEKSGFDSPKELVEAIIERYNVKLSNKAAKKAARRTRTKMTAQLRDQIKSQLEEKSMNRVAKETGISYVVIAKVRNGEYDHVFEVRLGLLQPFLLQAAAPNPFADRTHVELTVAHTQHVRVDVTDALGRVVRTLHDGTMAAGQTHRLTFEGAGLPSGLYLVRAATAKGTATARLLVLR